VEVESDFPQSKFHLKSLLNREEAFHFLRFFDFARGRLAPFWYVNPQTLWEITNLATLEITVKKDTEGTQDIDDFYKHLAIKSPTGQDQLVVVANVIDQGDTFLIQTGSAFDVNMAQDGLTSAHLARFAKDSIREVWSHREVCEISYELQELLPEGIDSVWGGLPDEGTSEFIFGGFPDTVYTLNGYWGGPLPEGPAAADWYADGGGHVAYFDPGLQPLGDAAWICIGGVLVRAYKFADVFGVTADNPPFLDQCGTPASNLSELLGWPASDDFSGSGCNSGVEDDDNWLLRGWHGSKDSAGVAPTIASSNLRLDIGSGSGPSNSVLKNESINHPGDFTIGATGLSMSHPAAGYYWFHIVAIIGGDRYQTGFQRHPNFPPKGHHFQYLGGDTRVASSSEAPSYKLVRTGNTLSAYYGNTQIGTGISVSGSLTELWAYSVSEIQVMTCTLDAISAVDGSGNPVYIDPAGNAC